MKTSIGVGGYARGDIAKNVEYVQAADRLGISVSSVQKLIRQGGWIHRSSATPELMKEGLGRG